MRTRKIAIAVVVSTGLFVTNAVGQHEDHHPGQAAQPADTNRNAPAGGMMSSKMMPQMMAEHEETGKLLEQLMKSFARIEAETDPSVLKQALAEHGSLIKELQAKMEAHSHKMQMMMGGPMQGKGGVQHH